MQPRSHNPLISAFLALFMVFVIPVCWYGALARAQDVSQSSTTNNNNNNEEREEHEERDEGADHAQISRPIPPKRIVIVQARVVQRTTPPLIVASQAHPLEPSRFSVRRLI